MELYVLDGDFQPIGVIDVFSSLLWNRKYYDVGDFEIYTTQDFFTLLQQGVYLHRRDAEETGIIETVDYTMSDNGQKEVSAKGRFLEQKLSERIINTTQTLEGTGEEVIRTLVQRFAISPTESVRKIEKLKLGNINQVGEKISFQVTWESLLDKIREIAISQELGLSLRYDYLEEALIFEVWQGKDRTQEQTKHAWAVFSPDYENVLSANFTDSIAEYKNFAYVAGEGEGTARIVVEVDQSKGEERRELYVDARDIRQTTDSGEMIPAITYKNMLKQRGLEKLAEYKQNTILEGSIQTNANLLYKEDFDLGDICTYVDHTIGIEVEQRITEITEIYENGSVEIQGAFGDQQLGVMQKLKRG